MIRATFVYLFVGLFVLLLAPFVFLWTFISRDPHFLYILARFCIRTAGFLSGVRVIVEGREKILLEKNYVFLSNHQGNFDGPVLCHVIPRDLRALIKKEMMLKMGAVNKEQAAMRLGLQYWGDDKQLDEYLNGGVGQVNQKDPNQLQAVRKSIDTLGSGKEPSNNPSGQAGQEK